MKIVGFGDFLIHFSPFDYDRFVQTDVMKMSFTGAEANVMMALAYWGMDTAMVTRLPRHALSRKGVGSLRACGVDTRYIAYGGERMGTYYLEKGASVRPSSVIYDRSHTAFSEANYEDFDWASILKEADILYLTGITPCLSETMAACCLRAVQAASAAGVRVFYDANYRPTLASPETAGDYLRRFAPYLDCLIANEEHIALMLGLRSRKAEEDPAGRLDELTAMVRDALDIPRIAIPVRRTLSASDARVYASFSDGDQFALSREFSVHVVDRVGSGDAFSAGLLYSTLQGASVREAVDFAIASNAIKHTVNSDVNYVTPDEISATARQASRDVRR